MSAPLPDPIIIIKSIGHVRVHTFVAGFAGDNIANATHVIESENVLVVIDGQFLAPYARQFREYADSLGKPIERLYVSHRHPDHWFGLGTAFRDVEMYALIETKEFIRDRGEDSKTDHAQMGDLGPSKIVEPQNIARPGVETIDGVKYHLNKVVDTEIDFLLTLRIPELRMNIVQDLIYSGTHLYLTKDFDRWIKVLGQMLRTEDELFLPGHGFPTDKIEVAKNIEYLAAAKEAFNNGLASDSFKDYLLQRYPERKCPGIFDIYLPRLFDGKRGY